jgi:hypothetical protein
VTQEAEIRRISVESQPGQIVCETLSQKLPSQKKGGRGWWSGSRWRPWVQVPVLQKKKISQQLTWTDLPYGFGDFPSMPPPSLHVSPSPICQWSLICNPNKYHLGTQILATCYMWVDSFLCWGSDFPIRSMVSGADSNPWDATCGWEVQEFHFKHGHFYQQKYVPSWEKKRYCFIWIPQFELIVKPLYEVWRGLGEELLHWTPKMGQVLQSLKQTLTTAPTDLRNPFSYMFMREARLPWEPSGPTHHPVAYL